MSKVIFEKIIKIDRKKIFDLSINYENFQKILPQYYPSIRIISTRGNVSIVEEHLRICGKEFVMLAKHVTETPLLHEIFIIGGDAKGTHITNRYEQFGKGTKLILEVDWKLPRFLMLSRFFGNNFAKEYSKIIDEFIIIVNKSF